MASKALAIVGIILLLIGAAALGIYILAPTIIPDSITLPDALYIYIGGGGVALIGIILLLVGAKKD